MVRLRITRLRIMRLRTSPSSTTIALAQERFQVGKKRLSLSSNSSLQKSEILVVQRPSRRHPPRRRPVQPTKFQHLCPLLPPLARPCLRLPPGLPLFHLARRRLVRCSLCRRLARRRRFNPLLIPILIGILTILIPTILTQAIPIRLLPQLLTRLSRLRMGDRLDRDPSQFQGGGSSKLRGQVGRSA